MRTGSKISGSGLGRAQMKQPNQSSKPWPVPLILIRGWCGGDCGGFVLVHYVYKYGLNRLAKELDAEASLILR